MTSNASNASNDTRKLTLRPSAGDNARLDALRARRRQRVAQADGNGPPDRMSRTALALHYMRLGMTQAEKAEPAAVAPEAPEAAEGS